MNDARDEIVITAMGLVGCLGFDAANACAAARAGLSRARELPFIVIDEESGEPVGVNGFAMAGLTDGFEGAGRVARILQLGLADLRRGLPAPDPTAGDRCAWLVALPPWVAPGDTGGAGPATASASVRDLIALALRNAGFPVDAGRVEVRTGDHATFGSALQEAAQRLQARHAECCVVGAADTLIDPAVLESLLAAGRLKTPNEPLGVSPGEGSAFFLVERGEAARRRGTPVLATLTGVATGVDEDHVAQRAPTGRALAGLAASVTEVGGLAEAPLLVSDYNGEGVRSAEYGHALFQLTALDSAFQSARTWFPAASFGDTGAASSAIGLAMVLRGFARRYAGAASALLLSSSAAEDRAVIGVRAAG